jgi:glutamate/tyrosine decarboxylase-like PLP-dependent enzyme
MTDDRTTLDPVDWNAFRRQLHALVDGCVDHLQDVRERPWRPPGEQAREQVALGDAHEGAGLEATAQAMLAAILPRHAGNTHPRFFGWVQGTGTMAGLMAELVAATMNSNCGGRDHGAIHVEREVIRWCADCFGLPATASGVLTSGTSQATVIALAAARLQALGAESRSEGIRGGPQLALYAAEGVHNASVKAAELLGLGAAALRCIAVEPGTGSMDMARLAEAVRRDRAAGIRPCCVIGTAGSVDRGAFDRLDPIAAFCAAEGLWFHVDGAFGAWTRLAEAPWCELARGIERADSIALDFHKWMFVQYDCGLILMRDEARHRAAFAARPAYLAAQGAGLGGGEPWYCDYGTDLSRSFRALKVWATLRAYGSARLGAAITDNCRLAAQMAGLVEAAPGLELAAPVVANVCCFSVVGGAGEDVGARNTMIVQQLQLDGSVVFSTTRIAGRVVMRAAITNHRTTAEDVRFAVAAVERAHAEVVRVAEDARSS